MKITHLKSSTELIESRGVRILTDPWPVDGEYYGAGYQVPPYAGAIEELEVDFIYISHIHPDHMSPKTLSKMRKDIPVLIHRFAAPFLRHNIERLGFDVTELDHGVPFDLGSGVEITIWAADNCNPELCGKFFGCAPMETEFGSSQIDTLSVITDGKHTLLNTNDCPFELAKETLDRVLKRSGDIDLLLVGYAGAGPYPQYFYFDDPVQRQVAADQKEVHFLSMAMQYIEYVKPRYFMPFAGTYTLGGSLSKLNTHRGVPHIADAFEHLVGGVREPRSQIPRRIA